MQLWEQAEIAYQCLCHPPVISYTILLGMGWSDLYCASLWLPAPVYPLRIFFPTPRRFILRLETSKAFPLLPRCSLAHHLAYPAVVSVIKSWKWLCDLNSSWVSFDLIYTSVIRSGFFGCDFYCQSCKRRDDLEPPRREVRSFMLE